MIPFRKKIFAALLFGAVCLTPAQAQRRDPVWGTWKLNISKSTFPGGPAPKSQTVKFAQAGTGTSVTSEVVGTNGQIVRTTYTAHYDGKRYAITGSPTADSVAFKRIDDWTVERTDTKRGRFTAMVTRVLSKDGKTLTVTTRGFTPQGRLMIGVTVFDRK